MANLEDFFGIGLGYSEPLQPNGSATDGSSIVLRIHATSTRLPPLSPPHSPDYSPLLRRFEGFLMNLSCLSFSHCQVLNIPNAYDDKRFDPAVSYYPSHPSDVTSILERNIWETNICVKEDDITWSRECQSTLLCGAAWLQERDTYNYKDTPF